MNLYRYTVDGKGIFNVGKQLLPDDLVNEVVSAKAWLPKPSLKKGVYTWYLTSRGNQRYQESLLPLHRQYLSNIHCEVIARDACGSIVYEDEFQVVTTL